MADNTPTKPIRQTSETAADRAPEAEPAEGGTLLQRFLKASGYKEVAVIEQNNRTRVFVTSNGGKYQLLKSGKVRRISGPQFPKEEVTE